MPINGDRPPFIMGASVSGDCSDWILGKKSKSHNSNDRDKDDPKIYSRSANVYNSRKKRFLHESCKLFDKVKERLNNKYYDNKYYPVGLKLRTYNSYKRMKKRRSGAFNSVILRALNREKNQLKFLMKHEDNSVNRYVFLLQSLQQYVDCLVEITDKIDGRNGLLDLIMHCSFIRGSQSPDLIHNESVGACQVYNVVTLKDMCTDGNDGDTERKYGGEHLTITIYEMIWVAEICGLMAGDDTSMNDNNDLCRSCCPIGLVDIVDGVIFHDECLLHCQVGRNDSLPGRQQVDTIRRVAATSVVASLRADFTYYSLETNENIEPDFCEQHIYFSYQANPYNHLLHLYLAFKQPTD